MAIISFDDMESKVTGSVCINGKIGENLFSVMPTESASCGLGLLTSIILLDDCTEVDGVPFTPFDHTGLNAGCGVSFDKDKLEISIMSPEDYAALVKI